MKSPGPIRRFMLIAKHGYDSTNWIFAVIGAGLVMAKLFGIAGALAVVLAFVLLYLVGRNSLSHEEELAKEKERIRKKLTKRKL